MYKTLSVKERKTKRNRITNLFLQLCVTDINYNVLVLILYKVYSVISC